MIELDLTKAQAEKLAWATDLMPDWAKDKDYTREEAEKIDVSENYAFLPEDRNILLDIKYRLTEQFPDMIRQTPDASNAEIRAAKNVWEKIRNQDGVERL